MLTTGRHLLAVAIVLLLAAAANAWELPLTVEEFGGVAGPRHISGGVPLMAGQAKNIDELHLLAADGAGNAVELPAQFRVLARWWRADNSIRWVLVDFSADFAAKKVANFKLTNAKPAGDAPKPAQAIKVEQTADAITITTGPARFVVNRKKFALLDHAYIDADGDGQFKPAEDLLATTADCGGVMEGTYGEKYFASAGTRSVEVIESGPLRVQVRARGQHLARNGEGYSKGMYGYDYIMNFYAGRSDVDLDAIITNNPAKSIGTPTFEDASLLIRLAGGATGYQLLAAKPTDGTLAAGESVCLYQDSNGADTWAKCQGFSVPTDPNNEHPGGIEFDGHTVSFRGYHVLKRTKATVPTTGPDCGEVIGQGNQARGAAHLFNDRGGLVVHMRNFWQQFPKAVEVAANGTLRVGLFPRECVAVHYLEDCSAKGHEIKLYFYSKSASAKPLDINTVADLADYPAYPRPPIEHIAATGALADLGPFTVPEKGFTEVNPRIFNAKREFDFEEYVGNAYGWQVFGSRWYSHGGHSSRGARQPIRDDLLLYSWFAIGKWSWLDAGIARSRQFRDVRAYRVDDQEPFGFKNWEAFRVANRSEDYTIRPEPKDAEIKKFSRGFWKRAEWTLPNPAHMTLDLPYDRYLLFGDVRSFENLRTIAAQGGYSVRDRKAAVHREGGWCWRTLFRYWELTGDKDAEAFLAATVKHYEPLIGQKPLMCYDDLDKTKPNWWFTQVFSRPVAMTALYTGNPQALALCKTLADSLDPKQSRYFCTLLAVLYHLTGEQKYRDAVLGADDGATLLKVSSDGDFPATAHWLLHQPPVKK